MASFKWMELDVTSYWTRASPDRELQLAPEAWGFSERNNQAPTIWGELKLAVR